MSKSNQGDGRALAAAPSSPQAVSPLRAAIPVAKCDVRVFTPHGPFRGSPCSRKAKVERDGRWYCGIHDPVKVKQRRDAKDAEYRARRDAEVERTRRRAAVESASQAVAIAAVQARNDLETVLAGDIPDDLGWISRLCGEIDALAQAIEARRAETQGGSVHESAVGNADAPKE